MYLMYIDESGDTGIVNSPSKYFVLSAIVVHENHWLNMLDDLILFRKHIKTKYGLLMKEEIHTSVLLNGSPKLKNHIHFHDKLDMLKKCLNWLGSRSDISVVSIRVDKSKRKSPDEVFEIAWKTLLQRFENTLLSGNFPGGGKNETGIILPDNTQKQELRRLLRKMRRHNQVPHNAQIAGGSRNLRLRQVIEDPVFRDSSDSYFHQMVDVVAYFARQFYEPNNRIKKKGARTFYNFLSNVINQNATNKNTPNKIVEI